MKMRDKHELFSKMKEKQWKIFWNAVDIKTKNSCWEWKQHCNRGYGRKNITINNQKYVFGAHQLAFWYKNKYMDNNLQVCHKCDNRKCANPNHLYQGTQKQNTRDYVNRGKNKLSLNKATKIRKEYAQGNTCYRELGEKYNSSTSHISNIINNKHWNDKNYKPTFKNGVKMKFSFKTICKMKNEYKNTKTTVAKLAKKYNIDQSYACKIIKNKLRVNE